MHIGPTYDEIGDALTRAVCRPPPADPVPDHLPADLVDPSRAPEGKHVFWAYGHVPHGWHGDATDAIERQIERFAPGFRDLVLARAASGPAELAARNANYVGGDIACGAFAGLQTGCGRAAPDPVRDPAPGGLPVLLRDPAGTGRARHVRPPRGPGRAEIARASTPLNAGRISVRP